MPSRPCCRLLLPDRQQSYNTHANPAYRILLLSNPVESQRYARVPDLHLNYTPDLCAHGHGVCVYSGERRHRAHASRERRRPRQRSCTPSDGTPGRLSTRINVTLNPLPHRPHTDGKVVLWHAHSLNQVSSSLSVAGASAGAVTALVVTPWAVCGRGVAVVRFVRARGAEFQ
jgi:hypothetical protein